MLHCDYEELQALKAGAELVLESRDIPWTHACEADPEVLEQVERIHSMLGSLSIPSLAEMDPVIEAVELITDTLDERLRAVILETDPSDETAVSLYFEWGRTLGVHNRLAEMAAEMSALIELMTGERPTAETAASVTFPD